MQNSLLLFLAIIFIGIITSYEDIKTGKIRNKWIVLGLIIGLLLNIKYIVFERVGFGIIFLNLFISVLVAYFLWTFKLWSAGDGKLFIVYALLIPIMRYKVAYFKYFPSFSLLINIFLPATFFLFLRATLDFIKKKSYLNIKDNTIKWIKKDKSDFVIICAGFSSIFLLNKIVAGKLMNIFLIFSPNTKNIMLFLMFIIYKPLSRLFTKKRELVIVIFVFTLIYFIFQLVSSGQMFLWRVLDIVRMVFLVIVLLSSFRFITNLYIERSKSKTWPFAIWMFLGVLITWFYIF